MLDWNIGFAGSRTQDDVTHGALGQNISPNDGALRTVELNPRSGVLDGESIVDLHENVVVEAQHSHHAVFEPRSSHASTLRKRDGLDRLSVQNEAQRVCIVHGHVHHNATASLRLIHAPALQVRRQKDSVENSPE